MTDPIILATRSGSEFIIYPNGQIDRMSLVSLRFSEWAPAGSTIDVLTEGQPLQGTDPDGYWFRTSPVILMAWFPQAKDPC